MKIKGLAFPSESVKAINNGILTQSRRPVIPQPENCFYTDNCRVNEYMYDCMAENLYCEICGRPQYADENLIFAKKISNRFKVFPGMLYYYSTFSLKRTDIFC